MSFSFTRICDRCGKEIPEGGEFTQVTGDVYQHSVKELMQKRLLQFAEKGIQVDLCLSCTEKLHDFIHGKEKEKCSGKS